VKRLYASTSVDEAQGIQALLEKAGIESTLDTKSGGAATTGAVVFGIYIDDRHTPRAVEILAAWLEKALDGPVEPDVDPES
jgi:hypothetical protein